MHKENCFMGPGGPALLADVELWTVGLVWWFSDPNVLTCSNPSSFHQPTGRCLRLHALKDLPQLGGHMDCGNLQTEHRTLSCRGPLAPACHAATSPKIVFSQVSLIQGDGICSPPVSFGISQLEIPAICAMHLCRHFLGWWRDLRRFFHLAIDGHSMP